MASKLKSITTEQNEERKENIHTKRTARFEYHRYNKHVCTIFSIFYSANIMYSQSSIPNKRLNGWLVSRLEYWMRFAVAFFHFSSHFHDVIVVTIIVVVILLSIVTRITCLFDNSEKLSNAVYTMKQSFRILFSHYFIWLYHVCLFLFLSFFFRYFDFRSLFSCSVHPWGYIYT